MHELQTVVDSLPHFTPEQAAADALLAARDESPSLVDRLIRDQEKAEKRSLSLNEKCFKTVAKELEELASGPVREIGAAFRADCAIAARSVLTAVNYRIFCDIWVDQLKPESSITEQRALEIKRDAGREFKRRGLTNVRNYFHKQS
jgi:hypothetical protein